MRRAGSVLMLAALLLAGCAGEVDARLREDPAYGAGYDAGCRTASSRSPGLPERVTRNDELHRTSEAYRAGWRAGYMACGGGPRDPLGS